MSGSTVGGIVGAAIGFVITGFNPAGAKWGWVIGSTAGAILFPGKGMDGPRLQDLRVQVSSYGKAIPRIWGTVRIAGNIIWSTDLKETPHEQGKGGPSATTYTYSASFQVLWCEGEVVGVRRKWANAKLKYDVATGNTGPIADGTGWFGKMFSNLWNSQTIGFTFYPGSETQTPDPTIQADKGHTPAYLGYAHSVFEDLELEKFHNALPQVDAEIVANGTLAARPSEIIIQDSSKAYHGAVDPSTGYIWSGEAVAGTDSIKVYDPVAKTTIATIPLGVPISYVVYCPLTKTFWCNGATGIDNQCFIISAGGLAVITQINLGTHNVCIYNPLRRTMMGGSQYLTTTTVCEVDPFTYVKTTYAAGDARLTNGVYSAASATVAFCRPSRIVAMDALTLSVRAILDFSASGLSISAPQIITYDSKRDRFVLLVNGDGSYAVVDAGTLVATTGTLSLGPATSLSALYYHDGTDRIYAATDKNTFSIYNAETFAYIGNRATGDPSPSAGLASFFDAEGFDDRLYSVNGGKVYLLHLGDMLTPIPVPVSEIVTDLSEAVGLTAADLDVSDISGVLCDGFVLSDRGSAQAAIEQLLMAYQIDVVESGGKVKYVRRASRSAVVIDPEEMGLHDVGQDAPTRLILTRADEVDLPRSVTVKYMNKGADYQIGAQTATRQTTLSRNEVTHELAVVMTDAHARAVAEAVLYATWAGRTTAKWSMSLRYAELEPTDLVSIDGNQILISKATRKGNMIDCEGVFHSGVVFVTGSAAGAAQVVAQTIPVRSKTAIELMDIPLLRDQDNDAGFYVAACGYPGKTWDGCVIFKSSDGGASWSEVMTLTTAATMGSAVTALGNFSHNVFDEFNTVTVRLRNGTLSSISRVAVFAGGNVALLGSEVIQFRTATLNADGSYTLSGLLRGRRGSPTSGHAVGDRFVLLTEAGVRRVDMATAEIGLERLYKAVSIGDSLGNTQAVAFSNTAVGLECLSPVHLGGGRDASGNLTIKWVRRTRIGGEWRDYVDAALGETSESYEVEVWDSSYATLKRTITGLSSPTTVYSAADQTTDFGGTQSTVYLRVYQRSATVGRGFILQGSI